ncbi:MAG: HD domain-containing protein [Clostridiales bacterium]|nr:HD domain-containing protein [Clostridiales bacterium]
MEKLNYERLSPAVEDKISKKLGLDPHEDKAIRRFDRPKDRASLWRSAFIKDIEKIMHSPYYNRYTDKTQVFSLYKNDDISHRAFHVQLVSRIARNIGKMLSLDCELIEAIALGHDIGHTPFGHAGERFLNALYHRETGRYFNHNVQSVRVLDKIFPLNLSLQTLDGILCHNGEAEFMEYRPAPIKDFADFDRRCEECYRDQKAIKRLVPNTLEGCVVRICDIIAYVGKDRQDALKTNAISSEESFDDSVIGKFNATIINNMTVNIVENSFGKGFICMDREHFDALSKAKRDNYSSIYLTDSNNEIYQTKIAPMFERLYYRLLEDLKSKNRRSPIFSHHIEFIKNANKVRESGDYEAEEPNQIVVDYIASMTDDYFIDLYTHLFGDPGLSYIPYFG